MSFMMTEKMEHESQVSIEGKREDDAGLSSQ
jgi:hypothetical protein